MIHVKVHSTSVSFSATDHAAAFVYTQVTSTITMFRTQMGKVQQNAFKSDSSEYDYLQWPLLATFIYCSRNIEGVAKGQVSKALGTNHHFTKSPKEQIV